MKFNLHNFLFLVFFRRQNFILLFSIVFFFQSYSQKNSHELIEHINQKLERIDNLISQKSYQLALSKLKELEAYSNYISNDKDRLNHNLRKAKAYFGNNEHQKSMDLLLSGLDELERLDYPHVKINFNKYVGEVFSKTQDYDRSLEYYKKALWTSLKLTDTINILESYLQIGTVFRRKGINDSAKFYYKSITNYPFKDEYSNIISRTYNNLSAEEGENGNLELAVDYANKSIDIKQHQKDTVGLAYALMNLSGVYYDRNEFEKAKESYLKAYNSVKNNNSEKAIIIKSGLLYNLAYSNEMLNEYKDAYKYLEKATDLTDSLAEASRAQNISEIEAKYNVEKQARITEEEKSKRLQAQSLFYGTALAFLGLLALAYIFYRNYRLKQQTKIDQLENQTQTKIINATIDAKEKERKAIAETLHDSVSALLSSANLHLQATKAQLKKQAPHEVTKAQSIVNEASVKIRDLSHDLISSVLLKFGLAFAVHDMCQKYSNSEIALHSDDDGIKRYHQDFEIKIHNIIEELVNNILKHSKAANATIMLAHRDNDMLSVRISDDGVGFNPRSVRGKDGLGLSHIEARIKVMKGVFNIVSSKNNGTNIFILVPIQHKEKSVSA